MTDLWLPDWAITGLFMAAIAVFTVIVRALAGSNRHEEFLQQGALPLPCGEVHRHAAGVVVYLVGQVDGPVMKAPLSGRDVVWAEHRQLSAKGTHPSARGQVLSTSRHPDGVTLRDESGTAYVWLLHAETSALPKVVDEHSVWSQSANLELSLQRGDTLHVQGRMLPDGTVHAERVISPQ